MGFLKNSDGKIKWIRISGYIGIFSMFVLFVLFVLFVFSFFLLFFIGELDFIFFQIFSYLGWYAFIIFSLIFLFQGIIIGFYFFGFYKMGLFTESKGLAYSSLFLFLFFLVNGIIVFIITLIIYISSFLELYFDIGLFFLFLSLLIMGIFSLIFYFLFVVFNVFLIMVSKKVRFAKISGILGLILHFFLIPINYIFSVFLYDSFLLNLYVPIVFGVVLFYFQVRCLFDASNKFESDVKGGEF